MESDITLTLRWLLKQSRPRNCPSEMTFKMYPPDPRICVVKALEEYFVKSKTKKFRNTNKLHVLISHTQPYGPVTKDTTCILRRRRQIMEMPGINIKRNRTMCPFLRQLDGHQSKLIRYYMTTWTRRFWTLSIIHFKMVYLMGQINIIIIEWKCILVFTYFKDLYTYPLRSHMVSIVYCDVVEFHN